MGKYLRSKTVWGALVAGIAHGLVAAGKISPEVGAWIEGAGATLFGLGVKSATYTIERNTRR